jgi:2,5-diketo-D-gluconate reductase A
MRTSPLGTFIREDTFESQNASDANMDPQSTVTLHTGSRMPVVGLGTWELANDTAGTVVSGDYGTQPGIGEAIKRSGLERERIYLVTKVE